ncbi:TetR/AcrR family transcriptional regulator [Nocardia sp. PE-7]|uniref:TetR/AcrR family transcriptional regulator n=1 Tax=Nocardia sp. PE-7 TaxID=3058426 RepID=UPI00265972FF|nr:TetR/AcrR family transcriptional regulator [Nocardia sp. PE-7]WKG11957.1 TetR/AcrR family transcriptional regulator [Nocardia sp. PE-7]
MTLEPPVDRRKRRTHTAVLDAAQVLFLREGYRGTTIDMLAAEADVAVSSIYANFREGKADVYAALAWRIATLHAAAMSAPIGAASTPRGEVAAVCDRYVAFHRENPLALRILALTDIDVGESELATEAKVRIDAVLGGLVESSATAVRLANCDVEPHALVMVSWATVNGAYSLFQRGIVGESTLAAMLAIARADLLSHVGDDHEA